MLKGFQRMLRVVLKTRCSHYGFAVMRDQLRQEYFGTDNETTTREMSHSSIVGAQQHP